MLVFMARAASTRRGYARDGKQNCKIWFSAAREALLRQ
jgi:hypothetical protein